MFQFFHRDITTRPFAWGSYRDETDDPFWEEFQEYAATLSPASGSRGSSRKAQRGGASSSDQPLKGRKSAAQNGWARLRKTLSAIAAPLRARGPEAIASICAHISTAEFWLGVGFGAVTRIATKIAILDSFPDTPGLATLASFAACAGAGLAAGLITYLVRARYRNGKRPPGAPQESYWGRELWQSAFIGLFGGFLGGYVTNAGAVIAQAGGFAVGASAGVAAGALHAGTKAYKDAQGRNVKIAWGQLALNSLLFGAFGGVLGVVFRDVFNPGPSLAAPIPVGEAGSVIYVPHHLPHTPVPYNLGNCATDPCGTAPPPAPPIAPASVIHAEPLPPPVAAHEAVAPPSHPEPVKSVVEHHAPKKVPHKIHHHHPKAKPPVHRTALPEKSENPCGPAQETAHTAKTTPHHSTKHAHRPKLRTTHKIIHKPTPKPLVLEHRPPLRQPTAFGPPVLEAPPDGLALKGPPIIQQPYDPCASGTCAPPCAKITRLDIKGPCSDPNTPCVEKIHFNAQGEATRAVLEPQAVKPGAVVATKPYFQVEPSQASREARWQAAVKGQVLKPKPEDMKITLILPLKDHALAPTTPTPV